MQTRQTRDDPEARYRAKRALVWLMYRQGWDRQRVLELFAVLDWMMHLPDTLSQRLWQDIESIEGETRMRYVTSIERLAIARGMQKGTHRLENPGKLPLKMIEVQSGFYLGKDDIVRFEDRYGR